MTTVILLAGLFAEKYKLWSSLLLNFIHPAVNLAQLKSKYYPQQPVPERPQSMFFL
jgi:hypothetical protein